MAVEVMAARFRRAGAASAPLEEEAARCPHAVSIGKLVHGRQYQAQLMRVHRSLAWWVIASGKRNRDQSGHTLAKVTGLFLKARVARKEDLASMSGKLYPQP